MCNLSFSSQRDLNLAPTLQALVAVADFSHSKMLTPAGQAPDLALLYDHTVAVNCPLCAR